MDAACKLMDDQRRSGLSRGRPALRENRNVADDILHAADICLARKSAQEVSTWEIAAVAGTRPAMIY